MTNPILILAYTAVLAIAVTASLVLDHLDQRELLAQVQSGQVTLECELHRSGVVKIDPAKVVDFADGRWFFVNGSAQSCTVTR